MSKSEPESILRFPSRHIGSTVFLYDSLPSTNDTAASLGNDSSNSGAVIVADHQTSGRGQHGRTWTSRPGSSLLMSVILHPPASIRRPVILTAWAAVAIGEAIRTLTGVQARIKWPNDLLIHGQKVCGILIEQRQSTVVGIGLNLNQTAAEFADAALPHATSLAEVCGPSIERESALKTVIQHLDEEYDRLISGELVPLESDWKWRIGLLGRTVEIELNDSSRIRGRLREMAFDGIILENTHGLRSLPPETVRHIFDGNRTSEDDRTE